MKLLLKKFVLGSAFLGTSLSAQARDISVSVDGVSYNCSGNGGGAGSVKLYCACEYGQNTNGNYTYVVNLRKIDLSSGSDVLVRIVSGQDFFGNSHDPEVREACNKALASIPVCRL